MNKYFLGIDVGSTSITSLIIDTEAKKVVAIAAIDNNANVTNISDKKIGRSEWDMDKIFSSVLQTMKIVQEKSKISPDAIGVTGQQQGLQLIDKENDLVGNFISWQDQRCKEKFESYSYLEHMAKMGGAKIKNKELPFFENTGCPLATGYTAPLLFWLNKNKEINNNLIGTTAPEYIASKLTNTMPVTDPTDALSWGVFDINKNNWNFDLINSLELNPSMFLEVKKSCSLVGTITRYISEKINIKEGTPVSIASGDHQCSFAGSVSNYFDSVSINIGTGGQTSVYTEKILPRSWLELRPFIQKGYLLAGVGSVGGRTFRVLKDFVQNLVLKLTNQNLSSDFIYESLIRLSEEKSSQSSDIYVSPLFTGSRENSLAKGQILNITPENFLIENISNELIYSIAHELHKSYEESLKCGANKKNILVGSGNGLKKNKLMQSYLNSKFNLKIRIGENDEEAAIGAALCSSVGVKKYTDIFSASKDFIS